MFDQFPDRVFVTCKRCNGAGRYFERVQPRIDLLSWKREVQRLSPTEATIQSRDVTCSQCSGEGFIKPKDGDVVEVHQNGAHVGYCTVPATFRKSIFVDMRLGDFVPEARHTKMIYRANKMLGPGDLALLVGWRSA